MNWFARPWIWPNADAPFAPGPGITTTHPPAPPQPLPQQQPIPPWKTTVHPAPQLIEQPKLATPPQSPPRLGMFASPGLKERDAFTTADMLKPKPLSARGLTSFAGMTNQGPDVAMPPTPHETLQSPLKADLFSDPKAIAAAGQRQRIGGAPGTAPELKIRELGDPGVPRGGKIKPRGGTIHYTGGTTVAGAVNSLKERGLSYNYLIDRDGSVISLVPRDQRAFHMLPAGHKMAQAGRKLPEGAAGRSSRDSIGYAFVGMGEKDLTPAQKQTLYQLASRDAQDFGFGGHDFFGHGELNGHKEDVEGTTVARLLRQQGLYVPTSAPDVTTAQIAARASQDAPLQPPQTPAAPPVAAAANQAQGKRPSSPAARSAPAASQRSAPAQQGGMGIMDWLRNLVAPQAQAQQPTAAAPNPLYADLDRLGITKDNPMRPYYETLAQAYASAPKANTGLRNKELAIILDSIGTGISRYSGDKGAQMITPGIIDRQSKADRENQMMQYQSRLQMLQAILPELTRQRTQEQVNSILQEGAPKPLPALGGPTVAPGPSPAVQMPKAAGPQLPEGGTAPLAPVQRQPLAPPPGGTRMAGAPNLGLGTPEEGQEEASGIPSVPQVPQVGQEVGRFAQPDIASTPGSAPAGPAGPGSKFRITPEDVEQRFPLPFDERKIRAMLAVDPKRADEMRQANESVLKQRDQFIKLYEVGRSTDDPQSVREKEGAKHDAKLQGDLKAQRTNAAIAAEGIVNTLSEVKRIVDAPDWSDWAVGRFDTSDEGVGPWPLNNWTPSGKQIARGATMFNEVGVDELRGRVESRMQAIAAQMKKFVRGAGEGTWSDRDQLALDKLVGDITMAQNANELKRRVDQVYGMINDTFAKPLGVQLKPLDGKQPPDRQGGQPQSASAEPVGATRVVNGKTYTKTERGWVAQ